MWEAKRIVCGLLVWSAVCLPVMAGPGRPDDDDEVVLWNPEEFRLRKELCATTTAWLRTRGDAEGAACDKIIASLLALDDPKVSSYFAAAQAAWLRENPQKAVEILGTVVERHGDEPAPIGAEVPVNVVGPMWAATILRESGSTLMARNAYESTLRTLSAAPPTRGPQENAGPSARNRLPREDGIATLCRLHIAEIDADTRPGLGKRGGSKGTALKHLAAAEAVSGDPNQLDEGTRTLKQWAAYERVRLERGEAAANRQLAGQREIVSMPMVAAVHLELAGITAGPLAAGGGATSQPDLVGEAILTRVTERNTSRIDTAAAQLLTAHNLEMKGNRAEAAERYTELFESKSFISPMAGMNAARLQSAQGESSAAGKTLDRVGSRYPGFRRITEDYRRTWKVTPP